MARIGFNVDGELESEDAVEIVFVVDGKVGVGESFCLLAGGDMAALSSLALAILVPMLAYFPSIASITEFTFGTEFPSDFEVFTSKLISKMRKYSCGPADTLCYLWYWHPRGAEI